MSTSEVLYTRWKTNFPKKGFQNLNAHIASDEKTYRICVWIRKKWKNFAVRYYYIVDFAHERIGGSNVVRLDDDVKSVYPRAIPNELGQWKPT